MLYKRRAYFDGTSKRIGYMLSKIPITPNQWTCLSLILAFVTLYLLASREFFYASVLFALTAFIDMIDGAVARSSKKVTKLGGYLDSVSDRLIEFVIILGFFFAAYPDFIISINLWLMLLLFGSFMSTYTRAAAFEKEVFKGLGGGVLEHTDRLISYLIIIIVSAFSLEYASYIIALVALLADVSAVQRFMKVVRNR
jgi:archaetidylinositol phosphate synthase